MNAMIVEIGPKTDFGRLYPRYDDAAGILAVESKFERPWPFGVDIDGRFIFDIDQRRVLANFDLHIPKRRWIKDSPKRPSVRSCFGDLIFSRETIKKKSFSLPLTVSSNEFCSQVLIQFGGNAPNRAVELSSSVLALLYQSELVGFFVCEFS